MELKRYQQKVISALTHFLELCVKKGSCSEAYRAFWNEQGAIVEPGKMPAYQDELDGVPQVCLKVPTGGGKTFIAVNAIQPIFNEMPVMGARVVVWLVPSDAILKQTYKALSNPEHAYRQKLDVMFQKRVAVYTKEQLLSGQEFSPDVVREQLSIFVLSYDSFRTSNKDGRKAFQENGNLAPFAKQVKDSPALLEGTDETALIQVVRSYNPVVIVDESHHAKTSLSIEMLKDFNPRFVLDLTATPRKGSNVIAFVEASELKRANMVKLPVIVYNRKRQEDVYSDAIHIRDRLEAQAKIERETSGRYIRPIVLFQAQPKNKEDSTTYQKIKGELMRIGIPEAQIKIKTADKDELKNIDLASEECPVRYIITVNALGEGWDCPFAYVLATVANHTSSVNVEQILGRVLRLPYAHKNSTDVLNLSYVITSSDDFQDTLKSVVEGLNSAGFTEKDYRIDESDLAQSEKATEQAYFQLELGSDDAPEVDSEEEEAPASEVPNQVVSVKAGGDDVAKKLLDAALKQNEEYEKEVSQTEDTDYIQAPLEVRSAMNVFPMNPKFVEEVKELRIPQFMLKTYTSLFSDESYIKLELEHLTEGFTLKDKDVQIDFNALDAQMARVDVESSSGATPKVWYLTSRESSIFKEWFGSQPSETRLKHCKGLIRQRLSRHDCINDRELREYVDRVVGTLTADQIGDLERSPFPYVQKIDEKVNTLLAKHRDEVFELWLNQGQIVCKPNYKFPTTISPTSSSSITPKALYTREEEMNGLEREVINRLVAMPNIKWWHRNISRRGFQINGPTHAYPDFMVMTETGKILLVETKGVQLDGSDAEEKAKIGTQWASHSGSEFRYFMVFDTNMAPPFAGAYSLNNFLKIVEAL